MSRNLQRTGQNPQSLVRLDRVSNPGDSHYITKAVMGLCDYCSLCISQMKGHVCVELTISVFGEQFYISYFAGYSESLNTYRFNEEYNFIDSKRRSILYIIHMKHTGEP